MKITKLLLSDLYTQNVPYSSLACLPVTIENGIIA